MPVYLGPAFYIEGSGRPKYFKMGDTITVTGSQVTVRDETFIIATTVKQGDEVLMLRNNAWDSGVVWLEKITRGLIITKNGRYAYEIDLQSFSVCSGGDLRIYRGYCHCSDLHWQSRRIRHN